MSDENKSKSSISKRMSLLSRDYPDDPLIQKFIHQGVPAVELIFQFRCLGCGIRCCMQPLTDNLYFSPYSYAYARKYIPKHVLNTFFDFRMLGFIICPPILPFLIIPQGDMCPFLVFHYNHQIAKFFIPKLRTLTKTTPNRFITRCFLEFEELFLRSEANQTGDPNKILGIPIHEVFRILLIVYQSEQNHKPEEYTVDRIFECLNVFFQFLRIASNTKNPPFIASCSIYPARPIACRAYPLGRLAMAEPISIKDPLFNKPISIDRQLVILQKGTCPQQAFKQGDIQTAKYFLQTNQCNTHETKLKARMRLFENQIAYLLKQLTKREKEQVSQVLLQTLYYSTEYIPNEETFYEILNRKLTQKFQQIRDKIENR